MRFSQVKFSSRSKTTKLRVLTVMWYGSFSLHSGCISCQFAVVDADGHTHDKGVEKVDGTAADGSSGSSGQTLQASFHGDLWKFSLRVSS